SARDIQGWEYQPLGPFLGKSFCTTISPWVVTPEALAPFRTAQAPRPAGDPPPLPYLLDPADQATGALDIELEVLMLALGLEAKGLPPQRLSLGNARHLYWTVAQLVTHHASGGCNLRPGDLFGTGTISAPSDDGLGSLLEISAGGRRPVTLASGGTRRFPEDGGTLIMRAHRRREGFAPIRFGACRGTTAPALQFARPNGHTLASSKRNTPLIELCGDSSAATVGPSTAVADSEMIGTIAPTRRWWVPNGVDHVLFLQRLLLHYGIYRRYPLRRWPAFRNAWRIAFR